MDIFRKLSQEEIEVLTAAPALVTILVGAADGKLDGEERSWSEKLVRARSYAGQAALQDYYRAIAEGFWVKIQHEMSILPTDTDERSAVLSDRLGQLNPILAKLDHDLAYGLYKGLFGLAAETAKASGGFLRMGSVSSDEHEWVKLPMITPIKAPEGHEEDKNAFDQNIWGE
jgi:hypothetical protein